MLHQNRVVLQPATDHGRLLQAGVLAIAALLYAWVLSRGSFDLLGAEQFGLAFNSMLAHMLQGRFDVDPASIGYEAFVHDGRTYAYFGPFPALLRLPLVLLPHWLVPDWQTLHVERLSCWLAMMCGIAGQASAVMTALDRTAIPIRKQLAPPLIVACALSGAPMMLGLKGALIYHEAILWAWALAMVFVALALPTVQGHGPIGWRRACALALCAGLCLLARSTTGAGLFLALGLLLISQRPRPWLLAPAALLGGSIALTGWINQGRWGSPFIFANLGMQTSLIDAFPDRLARLERHGLFDWHRLDIGMLYYVFPVWTDALEKLLPLKARLFDLYDAIEQPASSLLLTDPAWCLLSGLGMIAIVQRRVAVGAMLLAGGLMTAPALMLAAWYLAFRYRVEFAPLLLVLSCIGIRDRASAIAPAALARTRLALSMLCILQVDAAVTAGWLYAKQSFGPSAGYAALSLGCTLQPTSCMAPIGVDP